MTDKEKVDAIYFLIFGKSGEKRRLTNAECVDAIFQIAVILDPKAKVTRG